MARHLLISLLTGTALLLAPGCALIDAFNSPGDDEPDTGFDAGDGELSDVGDGEPGDGEPGDGEPGDGEPGDGEGPIEPGECETGASRSCDCLFEAPAAGTFPGEQLCDDDESWGECICPETCTTAAGESVYDGQPCGICEISTFSCEDDDLALCLEPLDTNVCGVCPAGPELLPPPDCQDHETLFCDQAQEPFCNVAAESPLRVNITGLDINSEDQIFYLFVAGIGPGTGCAQGWEFPVAALPSQAYQEAITGEFNGFEAILPPEDDSISSGVLRVLIQKSVPLYDEDNGTSSLQLTTHFACEPLFLANPSLDLEPYVHPYLFQGPYEFGFRFFNYDEFGGSPEDQFLFTTLSSWALRALIGVPVRPQALLFGCPSSICGNNHQFQSLFAQFHVEQARPNVPTPTFWLDFHNRFSTFLSRGENALQVHQVYEELYQEWMNLYSTITTPPSERTSSERYLFLRDNVTPNRRTIVNLTDFDGVYRLEGTHGGARFIADGIDLGRQSDDPPFDRIFRTGNQPTPYDLPLPIQGYATTDRPLAASISSDFTTLSLPPSVFPIRGDAAARYLLFDYLPRYLVPDVLQENDGQVITSSTYQTFANNLEMYRTLFPCQEVLSRLETAGMDADDLDRFATLCDEIYGDPDGAEILSTIQDLIPLDKKDWNYLFQIQPGIDCPVHFEADPIVGLRLRGLGSPTSLSCSLGDFSIRTIPSLGMSDEAFFTGGQLTMTRDLSVAPTEF